MRNWESAPPALLRVCISASLVVLSLLLAPSAASALTGHEFKSSFGAAGHGDGQLELGEHSGVAVNEATHNLYVADTNNHRISEFSEAGAFIRAFGADVGGAGVGVCTTGCVEGTAGSGPGAMEASNFIAVDNSAGGKGDVYVADTANNIVTKFEADGTLVTTWSTGGQLSGLGELAGIAVDSAGNLDVLNTSTEMFEYEPDGTFITTFTGPRGTAAAGLAVDLSGNFFKVNGSPSVQKVDPVGNNLGQVTLPGEPQTLAETAVGIAANALAGNLYVDKGGTVIDDYAFNGFGEVAQPGPACPLPESFNGCPATTSFGAGNLTAAAGLGVDATSGTIYVADPGAAHVTVFGPIVLPDVTTEAASPVEAESATLNGTISAAGGPEASCEFQITTEAAFNAEGFTGATVLPCAPAGPFTGSGAEAVTAEASGLATGSVYFFRLLGANENGSNPDSATKAGAASFRTLGASVSAGSATQITASGALISGTVNPNGVATSFAVEYVTESQFLTTGFEGALTAPVPAKEVGEGTEPVAVSQRLAGLFPGTTYRFRLVAFTGPVTAHGPEGAFTTFAQEGAGGRIYEMVSPIKKIGEVLPPEPRGGLGGSCGECFPGVNEITVPMQPSSDGNSLVYEGQPFSTGLAPGANQYRSQRSSTGWAGPSITPPLAAAGTADLQSGFKSFSSDLSRGVLFQSKPALSPEVPPGEGGKSFNDLYLWEAGNPSLKPLVTVEPPNRVSGPPTEVNGFELSFSVANAGTAETPSFEHLAFEANDVLTPNAPEVPEGRCGGFPASDCNLYEWVGGQLRLINLLPETEVAASEAVIGSGRRLSESLGSHAEAGTQAANVNHAISADGSRIFWSDGAGQVYVRINGMETVEVNDPGQFLTASTDGSKVLLTDGCIYDVDAGICEETLGNSAASFLGIAGASEDLSTIYFLDKESLAPGAVPEACVTPGGGVALEEEEEGKVPAGLGCNLYVYEEGEGEVSFIARLNEQDNNFGTNSNYGSWKASESNRTAQVTPDGSQLAFMSYARLSSYDNQVASGQCRGSVGVVAQSCFEVYQYDRDAESLGCPSCNPSGQRPLGKSNLSLIRPAFGAAFPQPENLLPDGRLFFESQDVLSAKDTNGKIQDVYEWTPSGVEGCVQTKGCIALVSSGHSPNDSMFVNATPDGKNAFFITREQLLPQDQDELLDVYDARVGGGFESGGIIPCGGEGCKGPVPPAPVVPSSGSSQFEGPGNQKPAKKKAHKKKKKHHKKAHHKKKHHKKNAHKRANGNRGGAK